MQPPLGSQTLRCAVERSWLFVDAVSTFIILSGKIETMRAVKGSIFSTRKRDCAATFSQCALPLSILLVYILLSLNLIEGQLHGQSNWETSFGIAWKVQGAWRIEGGTRHLDTGDAIQPGSLLFPVEGTPIHSVIILLPDGQRILYECFKSADCAHGFRVPALYRKPKPSAIDMLARIRAVMLHDRLDPSAADHQNPGMVPDEWFAVLETGNLAKLAGSIANLSNGTYTCNLRSVDHAYPNQSNLKVEKNAPYIPITVPGPGLYDLTISDELNIPRIDLMIAAVSGIHGAPLFKKYSEAKALLGDWNIDHQGWPIHEFHRAYLKSLMLGIKPQSATVPAVKAHVRFPANTTTEPAFSPKPGDRKGDIEVKLMSQTPHATIHFTVDGAQPLGNSQIYRAPIMVKGTGLIIKAFASSPGQKDSPVVTGFFKVGDLETEK